jgi:cytochrome P450
VDDLADEATNVLGAAADSTGNALTIAAYNVVCNPTIYARVSAELQNVFPDPCSSMDFPTLEKLPYLVSRLSHRYKSLSVLNLKDCRDKRSTAVRSVGAILSQ